MRAAWTVVLLTPLTVMCIGIAMLLTAATQQLQRPLLPSCAINAPEDTVVYRSQVPGAWDSCAAAADLVFPKDIR